MTIASAFSGKLFVGWHSIYTSDTMGSFDFWLRGIVISVLVTAILLWAELSFPMGSLLVFLLALSIGFTWVVITFLKGDEIDPFSD